jgi:hypothetical protein
LTRVWQVHPFGHDWHLLCLPFLLHLLTPVD